VAAAHAVLAETKGDLEVTRARHAAAAGRGPLGQARAIFDRLGATALLAETDRLLAQLAT
jgi:hypothetical protein